MIIIIIRLRWVFVYEAVGCVYRVKITRKTRRHLEKIALYLFIRHVSQNYGEMKLYLSPVLDLLLIIYHELFLFLIYIYIAVALAFTMF